jgi:hypothetical protein
LFPNRPYLDRVADYPDNGRNAVKASLAVVVEHAKATEAWAWEKSEKQGGCSRVFVNAHDQGTEALFSEGFRGDKLATRTVAVVATADTTTWENVNLTLDVNRTLDSPFSREKDVSMVCSLSFHLPADAIHLGAIAPLPTPGTGGERRQRVSNSTTPGADDDDEEEDDDEEKEEFVRGEAREEKEDGTKKKNATTTTTTTTTTKKNATTTTTTTTEPLENEDDRPISLAFRGNSRGFLRQRVIPALRSLNRTDWDLESGAFYTLVPI